MRAFVLSLVVIFWGTALGTYAHDTLIEVFQERHERLENLE